MLTVMLAPAALLPPSHTAAPGARAPGEVIRRINAPYFDGDIRFSEMAISWFGLVNHTDNHADVRVGYNEDEIYINLAAFDRRLWYDTSPSPDDLASWDAATVYLDLDGNTSSAPDANAYRFVAQLNRGGPRDNYQAIYRGDGSGWVAATIPFTATTGWRGHTPNSDGDDRAWVARFHIPFTSLGLSGPPTQGSIWGLGMTLHDRDDAAGTPITDKVWPETMESQQPATWGQLAFGMPIYSPLPATPVETVMVRQGLDGAMVPDADVGGGSLCGDGLDFWTEWGKTNYAGEGDLNIQNQGDIADWPCFSKYYVAFPLDTLPPGRVIISATLTLHQFGNAGDPGEAWPSLIQVLTVAEDWDEATLTWNNAPLAAQNVSTAWVDPLLSRPGWPGVPREWDVSLAVAEAYAAEEPLRLALYEADWSYHSGKYFVSSDTGDWNAEGRPTLRILWGEPLAALNKEVWPVNAMYGDTVTYTLSWLGTGQPLTMTDSVPNGLSAPGPINASGGTASYDAVARKVVWKGTPVAGQPTTVTFPVTVQVAGPLPLFNTAVLTDAEGRVSTDTATLMVDARLIWLPLLVQHW